jgi:predicted molibdopterin-dependent oxidoreductase YjgC
MIDLTIDGTAVSVPDGSTLMQAIAQTGTQTPTLCYLENLAPVNVCRVCVVELEGSRTLVPACSRKAETGMRVQTDSERVRHSRKMVLEFLGSSVDLSTAPDAQRYITQYGAHPERFAPSIPQGFGSNAEPRTVKIDNELYVRDYAKCILCYKCVQACGEEAQNTFAIAVAGRGFDATISTEYDVDLPSSACVYCGNCIGVCPTGALMFASEYEMRQAGTWDEPAQTKTDTICSYCGVGCTLTLHVQENEIVKVTSPIENGVGSGHLCVKGRFGSVYVQNRE